MRGESRRRTIPQRERICNLYPQSFDAADRVRISDCELENIDVSGNTFEDAPRGLMYKSGGLDKLPKGYRIHDNVVK